jgi:hypothetical protein
MLKNSLEQKHKNNAKMTKNGLKTGGLEVRNGRFFWARARPGPPRAPHLTPRRRLGSSGIDFPSFLKLFSSLWD